VVDEAERKLVFLFDENMPPRLAHALRELGESCFHVTDPEIRLGGAPDEIVLRYAGERGWLFVGRDHNILHLAHERAALREAAVGAYFLNQTLNKSLCAITRAIFRNWPEMKRLARSRDTPFLYLIRETSVLPLRNRHLGNPADDERKRERPPKGRASE
jgi:hypothetical protein